MKHGTTQYIVGDSLARLSELPDCSVHCCVTSPPYWGLRDYGTATWEGGDAECDHKDARSYVDGCIKCGENMDKFTPGCGNCDDRKRMRELRGTPKKNYKPKDPTRPDLPNPPASWSTRDATVKSVSLVCRKCGATRIDQQLGLESTPEIYTEKMVEVFREVKRVLRDDGTCWLNLGDSYASTHSGKGSGSASGVFNNVGTAYRESVIAERREKGVPPGLKPKDLVGIPWRVAFALQADGWYLRDAIIWHKPAPMPGSQTDRCTSSYEFVFLLAKKVRYFFDMEAVKEKAVASDRKNHGNYNAKVDPAGMACPDFLAIGQDHIYPPTAAPRNVWKIASEGFSDAHFATMPVELARRCVRAGTSERGTCSNCGKPREREIEKTEYTPPLAENGARFVDASRGDKNRKLSGKEYNEQVTSRTVGWIDGCECKAETIPATVLDPFGGAGTTALAANQLGRDSVYIELNPEYVGMAERRVGEGLRPGTFRDESKTEEAPLFAEIDG